MKSESEATSTSVACLGRDRKGIDPVKMQRGTSELGEKGGQGLRSLGRFCSSKREGAATLESDKPQGIGNVPVRSHEDKRWGN